MCLCLCTLNHSRHVEIRSLNKTAALWPSRNLFLTLVKKRGKKAQKEERTATWWMGPSSCMFRKKRFLQNKRNHSSTEIKKSWLRPHRESCSRNHHTCALLLPSEKPSSSGLMHWSLGYQLGEDWKSGLQALGAAQLT